MSNRYYTVNIFSKEEIPEQIKKQYRGFLPGRLTAKNLLKWIKSDWRKFAPPREIAQEVLKETERETAIKFLLDLLQDDIRHQDEVAWLLGQINPGDETAIAYLVNNIQNYADCLIDPYVHRLQLDRLWQIDPNNKSIIGFLIEIIQTTDLLEILIAASESLAKFDPRNKTAIAFLSHLIKLEENNFFLWAYTQSLGKIEPANPLVIQSFIYLINDTQYKLQECYNSLINILEVNSEIDLSEFYNIWLILRAASQSLGEIDPGNMVARAILVKWINPKLNKIIVDDGIRLEAAESLGEIVLEAEWNEIVIITLIHLIDRSDDWEIINQAIISLEKFGRGNEKAIAAIETLIQSGFYDLSIVESLGTIDPGNQTVIEALIQFIVHITDERKVWADKLEKITPSNLSPKTNIFPQINVTYNNQNQTWTGSLEQFIEDEQFPKIIASHNFTDEKWAKSLERILQGNHFPKVVPALKHYMTDEVLKNNIHLYTACHDAIWRCAENMSYPEFYHAWHDEVSSIQDLENPIVDIASQLQPTSKTYPIVINMQALQDETDTSAISQELCNQVYLTAFPDNPEIPQVNNAPQLKRILPQVKTQLQTKHLILIIEKCEPNKELTTFCRKLTDVLHLGFITNKNLEMPLISFSSHQLNLLDAIQSWINEIE